MNTSKSAGAVFSVVLAVGGLSHADFKYTQQSKMTGGSLLTMTKSLGVFSKNARQMDEPQLSTIAVKGNRMRSEHSAGTVEIIDLDARRFINIDTSKKTYSTMTFEEFKANMQRMAAKAKEQQAKAYEKHPEAANIKITPKVHSEETGATRTILDLPTKEVKWQIEMQMESTDLKAQEKAQSASMTMNTDAWIAPDVPGYDEMRQFYMRMSKELDWMPGMMGNMMGMNAQMGPAMKEFQKNIATLKGMPLLQNMSFGMGGAGMTQGQAADSRPTPPPQHQADDSGSVPTSARDAISKGFGGMLGGFGKKKKQKDAPAETADAPSSDQSASASGALMEMRTEVTQYSRDSLDKQLFEIPAGYTQVQADPDQPFGGTRKQ
jgi:hypothetical protein